MGLNKIQLELPGVAADQEGSESHQPEEDMALPAVQLEFPGVVADGPYFKRMKQLRDLEKNAKTDQERRRIQARIRRHVDKFANHLQANQKKSTPLKDLPKYKGH